MSIAPQLDSCLAALPAGYPGPGGAVAVLRDGAVLARHCWGWADAERRLPFTPATMALICSITKQFTCGLLLDRFPDPTALDDDVRRTLPLLEQSAPATLDLCHNQSGLRDYWALTTLCGSPVEGAFGPEEARRLIGRTRTLHFAPGTRYSYANQNFRILSDIVERRTGQPYADLLRGRVFDRAGMATARLNPDTATVPGGSIGYEGSLEAGFRPAVNRIHWTGDAGIAACLDDMIAWERFIDATRDDADGLYRRLSAQVSFRDGAPAGYGFGLSRAALLGRPATSHGGGLRGWRSFRAYLPAERVSVVVLFNHMADARAAAVDMLAALLGRDETAATKPGDGWAGRYIEPETGLAVRIAPAGEAVRFRFASDPETLTPTESGVAGPATSLSREGDAIHMARGTDNLRSRLQPCDGDPARDVEGVFHCAELGADLTCVTSGGVLYAAFSGDLGQGEMQPLQPFAADVWLLPCPRALDYSPPGDWTLRFRRGGDGAVTGVQVGCWLARGVDFRRA